MILGFTILVLFLYGAALFFAYRSQRREFEEAKRDFQTQFRALQSRSAKKLNHAMKRIGNLETRQKEAITVINQLKMSAPTPITTPATPDWRQNMEDRAEKAAMEARVVGKGNN